MGNEPVTRYSYAVDMTLMFQLRIFVCAVVSDDDDGEDNVDYVDDGVDECVCVVICNHVFFAVFAAEDPGGGCLNEIRYMFSNAGSYLPDVRYCWCRVALKQGQAM